MSYTNKKVTWQGCSTNPIQNEYGDIVRKPAVSILARKQPHQEVVRTAEGTEILTKHIFYVDPRVEPQAANIARMDLLDDEKVYQVYEMCNLSNSVRMYRFITI